MKALFLSTIFFVISNTNSYSQKEYSLVKDVYQSNELVFYGYDYTHFKLTDVSRMEEDIKKYTFVWIAHCLKYMNEEVLSKGFDKKRVIFNLEPTLSLNKKLISTDLVGVAKNTINKDSIQSFINQYNIAEKEGIGFSVILECFHRDTKKTSGYITFFDIATKKVLMSDYIASWDENSYDLVIDWGIAVEIAFKKYMKEYKKDLKEFESNKILHEISGGEY